MPPSRVEDLPPGRARAQLERLPAKARERAMAWLHRFNFPVEDLNSIEVDAAGNVAYADHFELPADEGATASDPPVATVGAVDEAFNLHSRPGAPNVVYLDFTGHTVTGTAWNGLAGTDPLVARPFDLDGSPTTFGATELAAIAEIWARVAEDYAPFNIDVTTEEPTSFDAAPAVC